jgi:hypothetical protein
MREGTAVLSFVGDSIIRNTFSSAVEYFGCYNQTVASLFRNIGQRGASNRKIHHVLENCYKGCGRNDVVVKKRVIVAVIWAAHAFGVRCRKARSML